MERAICPGCFGRGYLLITFNATYGGDAWANSKGSWQPSNPCLQCLGSGRVADQKEKRCRFVV